jgi:hypothetical protein
LHRNEVQVNKPGCFLVRVRNCTHLLAAQSVGVEKIQQDRPVGSPGDFLRLGQII